MSNETDDCRARVEPMPDGRWRITIVRLYGSGWPDPDKVFMWHRELERRYAVSARAYSRTKARARRKASRMLARLRRAIANDNRERFEVER